MSGFIKNILERTFESEFNLNNFKNFINHLFNGFDFSGESNLNYQLGGEESRNIRNFSYLGNFTDAEGESVDVLVVELHSGRTVERARNLQRNLIGRYLKNNLDKASNALVAFYSGDSPDWRLSFIKIETRLTERGVRVEIGTPPKRYSFLVGKSEPSHTAKKQLFPLLREEKREKILISEIEKAFSVEKVTKEFYIEIAKRFTELVGGERKIRSKKFVEKGTLKLPSTNDDTVKKEFAVRLIGRLLFCWFLKKKTPDNNVETQNLASLLPQEILSSKAVKEHPNYYHTILEPLFFEVLNTPIDKRKKDFKDDPWANIPFLNGGLFEPHHNDYYEPGALGISRHINTLKVPDNWFKDLFEIFETFNFTIDENTSIDIDLSVDPEMLGRIFENLLAEINPETGETARKATGSYYTPRPIVEYMVDESLKQFLITQTSIPEDKLSKLLSYGDTDVDLMEPEKDLIIDALDRLKIIDPACGSGAFPMGILQKMLLILQKVDPQSKKWLSKKLEKIESKILRDEAEKKLRNENWDYVHKLGIIQSSIYGVDIQPIATEISKLRFFLSLIVDEKIDDSKPNRGVEPLPNLEFKFVSANSLIGLPKRDGSISESPKDIEKLKRLREAYFTSFGEEKKEIEEEFTETQKRMFEHSLKWKARNTQTLELSQWNPFADESSSWFDPEWMFGVRNGFDVVIANPPYVFGGSKQMILSKDKKTYRKIYHSGTKKVNLFAIFIEQGIRLLRKKGFLTYIVPNTLLRVTSYSNIREYIYKNTKLIEIVDLDIGIFENVTASTIIISLEKEMPDFSNYVSIKRGLTFETENLIKQKDFENRGFIFDIFAKPEHRNIINKLSFNSVPLGSLAKMIRFGVVITKNFDKVVDEKKLNDQWKPFLEGNEIGSYYIKYLGRYLFYKKKLLHRSRTPDVFETRKILIQRITGGGRPIKAVYDTREYYNKESIINLILKTDNEDDYKFILSLLNSKLINWFYKTRFTNESKLTVNLSKEYLGEIPIKKIASTGQKLFVESVDNILALTKDDDYFSNFCKQAKVKEYEQQIDRMVYELYGLTPEEVDIVEGRD